jgi:hypothetical protein
MEDWEFLIQREGDRGWRPIKTSNLQLMEGRYRLVVSSNLTDTEIQSQITHQVMGENAPARRSQIRKHVSNAKGLVVVIPFTNLRSGMWQFICSGTDPDRTPWQQILHLKVLPNSQTISPVAPNLAPPTPTQVAVSPPTEPSMPLPNIPASAQGDTTLDRLLAQIERDSFQPASAAAREILPQTLHLTHIKLAPTRLIELAQSTFAELNPGDRLTITGGCNLQLVSEQLIQDGIVSKISICLRHSQTAEIIAEIDEKVPPYLHKFAFNSELELPIESTTNLLIGEVSLYDLGHNQVGSCGFTVTLLIKPPVEFDLSFFQYLEDDLNHRFSDTTPPEIPESIPQILVQTPHLTTPYPSVPNAYRRESLFAKYPEIQPVPPPTPLEGRIQPPYPNPAPHGQMDVDSESRSNRNCDTLEIVSED